MIACITSRDEVRHEPSNVRQNSRRRTGVAALPVRATERKLMDENNLPLESGYCGTNLTDPSKRKESYKFRS
jgi:hypothetical protein